MICALVFVGRLGLGWERARPLLTVRTSKPASRADHCTVDHTQQQSIREMPPALDKLPDAHPDILDVVIPLVVPYVPEQTPLPGGLVSLLEQRRESGWQVLMDGHRVPNYATIPGLRQGSFAHISGANDGA